MYSEKISLGAGSQFDSNSALGDIVFKKQRINISLQVQNLFNTRYFNHTSYYRLINIPEPGRNFIINISVPFSGKIK